MESRWAGRRRRRRARHTTKRDALDRKNAWFFEHAFFEHAFSENFAIFWRARSRLYQNEILQENKICV